MSFQSRNATDQLRSGTGGEIGELDELLENMAVAKRDLSANRKVDADVRTEQVKEKVTRKRSAVVSILPTGCHFSAIRYASQTWSVSGLNGRDLIWRGRR